MTEKNSQVPPRPVVLCILDGWGDGKPAAKDNAIARAHTPFWDKFVKQYPHSLLNTSGLDVGLPVGQMGNSEVGHMNIGGGRIVMQDLPRIDQSIEDGSLAETQELVDFIQKLKKSGGVCHLMGLLSDGGVHAHINHMLALAKIVVNAGIEVKVHAFLDGRDTAPGSASQFIKQWESDIAESDVRGSVSIATASGRYYAMDRDNRWDRVKLAYDAMIEGKGEKASTASAAFLQSEAKGKSDEFVLPTVVGDYKGAKDGDGFLMANFRSDRARQVLTTLVDPTFKGFERNRVINWAAVAGMVEYSSALSAYVSILFPPQVLTGILGEIIANEGKKQLRIAETEKYAHVTFFFNGGKEELFEGESRELIPSPDVATYDLKPEMSAPLLTEKLVSAIHSGTYDLIVVNYANTDMVGHTGSLEAAMKAVEAVDKALGKLEEAVLASSGVMFITADHGNAEMMSDPDTGKPHTAHTTNPVPFVMVSEEAKHYILKDGRLCDIAPTLLDIMKIAIPKEMTGNSLVIRHDIQQKTA